MLRLQHVQERPGSDAGEGCRQCQAQTCAEKDAAHAILTRSTCASSIGQCNSAATRPSRMEPDHSNSYDCVASNTMPPSQTPKKEPTWWPTKTKPNSVE